MLNVVVCIMFVMLCSLFGDLGDGKCVSCIVCVVLLGVLIYGNISVWVLVLSVCFMSYGLCVGMCMIGLFGRCVVVIVCSCDVML